MSSTSTNKQPLLVDRPLFDSVRITTQTVGQESTNTLFVQGGQAPSILVDMDANDTSSVAVFIYQGAAQTDIRATQSLFSGYLVA